MRCEGAYRRAFGRATPWLIAGLRSLQQRRRIQQGFRDPVPDSLVRYSRYVSSSPGLSQRLQPESSISWLCGGRKSPRQLPTRASRRQMNTRLADRLARSPFPRSPVWLWRAMFEESSTVPRRDSMRPARQDLAVSGRAAPLRRCGRPGDRRLRRRPRPTYETECATHQAERGGSKGSRGCRGRRRWPRSHPGACPRPGGIAPRSGPGRRDP